MSNPRTRIAFAPALMAVALPAWAQTPGTRFLGSPATINEPGAYVLTRDVRLNSSTPMAFEITADGVTPDMNGHAILSAGGKMGTGVMVSGAQGVKVTNGSLADLAFGVVVSESVNVEVSDLRIRGLGTFVRGGGSRGNRIAHNTLTAGTNGVLGICYNPAPTDPRTGSKPMP